MTDADRIADLERELAETRLAAARMMLSMADAIVKTPEGRADLARGFEEAAAEGDPISARLARMVADGLRAKDKAD